MAKKKAGKKVLATEAETRTSQARLELPADEMERVRRAARSIGLSLMAFIRVATLEKMAETEKKMGLD